MESKIDEERRKKTIEEIYSAIPKNSICRDFIKTKKLDDTNIKNYEKKVFGKIGINSLIDRVWFVDDKKSGVYYDYKGIGSEYGASIGLTESKIVLTNILESCQKLKKVINFQKELCAEAIDQGINKIEQKNLTCTAIVTNIYDQFLFWHMDKELFKQSINKINFGLYRAIPVYETNALPTGKTLLIDSNAIGELVIKKTEAAIVEEFDRKKAKNDIPTLTENELSQKILISVYEILRFEPGNAEAAVLIESTPKEK